jgi:hypothetical protein
MASTEPRPEPVKLLLWSVVSYKGCGSFEQVDHGIERTRLVERRAIVTQRRVGFLGQALAQRPHEAGLADPGLA